MLLPIAFGMIVLLLMVDPCKLDALAQQRGLRTDVKGLLDRADVITESNGKIPDIRGIRDGPRSMDETIQEDALLVGGEQRKLRQQRDEACRIQTHIRECVGWREYTRHSGKINSRYTAMSNVVPICPNDRFARVKSTYAG